MDATAETPRLGTGPLLMEEPVLRWAAHATTIADIERELARIWATPRLVTEVGGVEERHVAARTSVMNLVVIARRPETGDRCATTISALTGRHPSRTLIISIRDPDGPNWLDARIDAHCVVPREDVPEVCAEVIHLSAGGATGRHLDAIVAPLLVHDLPVTIWWPNEPSFGTTQATDLLPMADRLIVDGSSWGGSGLRRLREMAGLVGGPVHDGVAGASGSTLAITDFALARQSRWREAIASVFDAPEILPYLRYVRRITVTYAIRDASGRPDQTNVVKPVYHVAWFASRLGMMVRSPLARGPRPAATDGGDGRDLEATLTGPHGAVAVTIRPVESSMPSGTTLSVELGAERRGSTLDAVVTAEAETVDVRCRRDGAELPPRSFLAPRRTDVDLLAEAIEAGGRDALTVETIRFAAALAGDTP
jgi:glucose-6-phosphate dehydrogenase assembly protein OpcA